VGKKHKNLQIDRIRSIKAERIEGKPRIGKNDPVVVEGASCRLCKGPVVKVPWNTVAGIMYCDTSTCRLYHTPIQPEKSYAERMGKDIRKIKDRLRALRLMFMENGGEE